MTADSTKDFTGLNTELDVGGQVRGNPIDEDVRINPADLDYEFQTHPEKYAWWAFLAEHAKAEVDMKKNQLAVLYAQLDFNVRDKARLEEIKAKEEKRKPIKYTEKMVESEVTTHQDYQKAQLELLEARKAAGLATAGRAAMDHRRDMLLQIGANYRTEGQADPVILKEAAKEKARERARNKAEKAEKAAKAAEEASNPPGKTPPGKRPPGKRPPGKPVA
jgi:hypothetical protein